MARQQDIAAVQMNLPSWAGQLSPNAWNSTYIGTILDTVNNNHPLLGPEIAWRLVNLTIRQFWIQRVSETQPLTDVHDASVSRPLSQDHEHAVGMLKYWDGQCGANLTTHVGKIRRRYRKRRGVLVGVDPFGFGGPYVRTD